MYIGKTKGKEPNQLMIEALAFVDHRDRALDLGAGAMSDARYMREQGFREIDAVDIEPVAAALAPEGITVHTMPFEEFSFPADAYDFINAQQALSFAGKEYIDDLAKKVRESLKCGGVFSGTFFGTRDWWASDPEVAAVTREWMDATFNPQDWNISTIKEKEETYPTGTGRQKKWHVFSVIASRSC